MISAGIEPNVNTYSALIDGCARAGQVAKAFGAYGIMSSKVTLFHPMHYSCYISQFCHKCYQISCPVYNPL
jgi:pentatricopeptide repeat protein